LENFKRLLEVLAVANNLTVKELADLLKENISELKTEAEFQRGDETLEYAVDKDETPLVKVAIGNVPVAYDLWEGLRNPALAGLYPAGLQEIWEYYANRRKQKVDESGRSTIFQVPRSFDYAIKHYRRAVIISVMLPFSRQIVHDYVCQVIENKRGSSHKFLSMYEHLNRLLDKAINRTAIELVTDDSERVVVAMTSDTVKTMSTEAIPQTRQGVSHGPSKGGNYSQKSIAALVGLGQFGMSLARTLMEKNAEVLAVDTRKNLVEEASGFVTEALVMDATDESELARLEPGRRDAAVCAIGDDSREASIICTALLRQMGTPLVVARANDKMHQRILQLVGAHQIINPEQEFGKRFASRLLYRHVVVDTSLGDDLLLTEISVQPSMVGRTLIDLELPKRFGIMVVGIRRVSTNRIHQPSPAEPLREKDNLISHQPCSSRNRILARRRSTPSFPWRSFPSNSPFSSSSS